MVAAVIFRISQQPYCQTPPWIYQMYIHGLNFGAAKGFYPKWQYLESRETPIFRKLLDKGLAAIGLFAESVVEPLPEIYRRIEAVDRAALKRYTPQPYPSKMTLFRAQEKIPDRFMMTSWDGATWQRADLKSRMFQGTT